MPQIITDTAEKGFYFIPKIGEEQYEKVHYWNKK